MIAGTDELSWALSAGPGGVGLQFCAAVHGSPDVGFPEDGFQTSVVGPVGPVTVGCVTFCWVGVTVTATATGPLLVGTVMFWVSGNGLLELPLGGPLPLS